MRVREIAMCLFILGLLVIGLTDAKGGRKRPKGERKKNRQVSGTDEDINTAELMCKMYQESRDSMVEAHSVAKNFNKIYTRALQTIVKIRAKHLRRRKDSLLINKSDMNGTDPFQRLQLMSVEMEAAVKVLHILEKSSVVSNNAGMDLDLSKLIESLHKRTSALSSHLKNISDAVTESTLECIVFVPSMTEEKFSDVQNRYKRKMKKLTRKLKRSVKKPFEDLRGKASKKFGVLHRGLLDDITNIIHGSRDLDVMSMLETVRTTARESGPCYGKSVRCPK